MTFYSSLTDAQKIIHDALCDSHYIAGLKAGYAAAQNGDQSEEAFAALLASRAGHLEGYKEAAKQIEARK